MTCYSKSQRLTFMFVVEATVKEHIDEQVFHPFDLNMGASEEQEIRAGTLLLAVTTITSISISTPIPGSEL